MCICIYIYRVKNEDIFAGFRVSGLVQTIRTVAGRMPSFTIVTLIRV